MAKPTSVTKTIAIGPGVTLDLDRLISTRLLVQANSGGGKSWALRRLLEQTHGRVQQIVLDPEGEFASLRERYDYVLAARQGGDTAADPRTAKMLAERLLELGVSAILDIYELNPGERIRFVQLFLEALVDAPKQLWHPVLVVIDEAHVYCPEKDEAASAAAVKGLCSRGRKRGFCAVLATQRLSKLAKDAAAECNNKLIGRTSLDVDMKRAAEELGFTTKDEKLSLRELEDGQFFSFGPALGREITKVTVGAVQTTHPKAGSHLAAVVPPPTDKVKALLPKLSDLPAEAEAREKTVKDLKTEIATLKRELTEARKAQPPAPKTETKRVDVLTDGDRQLLAKWHGAITESMASTRDVLDDADARLERLVEKAFSEYLLTTRTATVEQGELLSEMFDRIGIRKILDKLSALSVPPAPPRHTTPSAGLRVPASRVHAGGSSNRARPAAVVAQPSGVLTGPEQKILTALAELKALGLHPADKQQLGLMAGYTNVRSGGFSEPLGRLVAGGYVTSPKVGAVAMTDAGEREVGTVDPPTSSDELQARILGNLSGPEQKLLKVLIAEYPQALTKEDLGAATNYTNIRSGGFSEPLGHLSTLGLVDNPERGKVVASPALFLEA